MRNCSTKKFGTPGRIGPGTVVDWAGCAGPLGEGVGVGVEFARRFGATGCAGPESAPESTWELPRRFPAVPLFAPRFSGMGVGVGEAGPGVSVSVGAAGVGVGVAGAAVSDAGGGIGVSAGV